jgi:hypothetical protein
VSRLTGRRAKAKKQRSEVEMPAAPDVLRAPLTAYKDSYGMWEKLKMLHKAKAKQRVEFEKQRLARDRAESQTEREQTATE